MKLSKINSYIGPIRNMYDVTNAILNVFFGKSIMESIRDLSNAGFEQVKLDPRLASDITRMLSAVPQAFNDQLSLRGHRPEQSEVRTALENAVQEVDATGMSILDVLRMQLRRHFRTEIMQTGGYTGQRELNDRVFEASEDLINRWLDDVSEFLWESWGDLLDVEEQDPESRAAGEAERAGHEMAQRTALKNFEYRQAMKDVGEMPERFRPKHVDRDRPTRKI